ncbi:uncharacterized protein HD556DRAFT_1305771 [Suillus plorans]|uniref:Uncharacterized protein n=1 Tax=Suillus plorans TaxID=116603 RepID=A0A9P7DN01_9AGAM|nr:uncharacterized protein HD556DRAFT_1305771 [Suillus plorans]KAG1798917.1 hypothetical protein HD556DRAFT_1305771 [Suillus plorans]
MEIVRSALDHVIDYAVNVHCLLNQKARKKLVEEALTNAVNSICPHTQAGSSNESDLDKLVRWSRSSYSSATNLIENFPPNLKSEYETAVAAYRLHRIILEYQCRPAFVIGLLRLARTESVGSNQLV